MPLWPLPFNPERAEIFSEKPKLSTMRVKQARASPHQNRCAFL